MSMSDCIKCWNTPCTCGWEYRHMSKEKRIERALTILGIDNTHFSDKLIDLIPDRHPQWTGVSDCGRYKVKK
jgi:hypothetical protein